MSKREEKSAKKRKLTAAEKKEIRAIMERARGDGKPHTAQDTLPFRQMFPDGLCKLDDNTWSKCIEFEDVNYQLAQPDQQTAIFEGLCDLYNSHDSSIGMEISLPCRHMNQEDFLRRIEIAAQGDAFDGIRQLYTQMLRRQLEKGNNGIVKTKLLVLTITESDIRAARARFSRITLDALNHFKVMGALAKVLDGREWLELLHGILHPDGERFAFDWDWLAPSGLHVKDFIAPSAFRFASARQFQMGTKFCAASFLQITAPEMDDRILAELLNTESDMLLSIHIRSMDQTEAIKTVKRKITDIDGMKIDAQKRAVREGFDMDIVPTDIATYAVEAKNILRDLQSRNERMFLVTFLVVNMADSKRKLDNDIARAASVAQQYNCQFTRLDFQQEQGFVSALPLGVNQIHIQRGLTMDATEAVVETTAPEETKEATDPFTEEPAEDSTEETEAPAEDTPDESEDNRLLGAEAYASTQKSIMLFDFADNGDYTTRLNYQVSCTYKPNGSGTTRTAYVKNMGWHFARYGGVAHADEPLYCIEPWRNYAASTSGNSVDRDVTLNGSGSSTGSNVWYSLPSARREAIGLILLYSNQQWNHSISVTTTKKDSNPNVPLRVATQILIYEIVCGLRDSSSFNRNSYNECGTAGDVFYNAAATSVSGFTSCYNSLVSAIQSAKKIPSFCGSSSSSNTPTIRLSGDTGSAYDSNGVLPDFSFSNGNGARFSKSGNTLNITKTGDISESTVFTATRYLPSASNSSYNIWYMSGSSYQTTISLYNAGSSGLNAYFKIKAPSLGNISLTKNTEDGANLSGWKFGIYSDSACTKLVSGPYTTNSSGKLSVTGLTAGTYYVKELCNTDSSIDSLYSCASTNPQRVTITSGQTASVSFYNKRNTGSVQLVKKTNTGENLGGWKIGLYTDSACTNSVSGSPFTTGADGTVTVSDLQKGTYYAKEISTNAPYWEFDTAVKSVTVAVGQTAEVTFTNTHYGRIEIRKTTNTGNQLGGWTFRVRDSEGNSYGDFTTDENGYACTQNLPLGWYTVVELPTEDNYWLTELGFHDVTVKAGETTMDTWLNKEQGLVWFYKKTNTGQSVEGWHITVYSDEACTQKVGTLITNADGKAGYYLDPGTYWAKETGDEHGRFEDEYWMVDETIHKFEIKPHEDVSITFTNVQYGRLKISKTMEGGGSVEGWQFKITDTEGKVLDGSPFASNKDGIILTGNLLPSQYTVEELLPENSLYQCISENPQTVTVKQGEIAEVSFVNALRTGKVTVEKIDISGAHLAGATFRLEWSEDGSLWHPVTYSETIVRGGCSNPDVTDGSLTTGTDGLLEWDNLYPGLQYRLTETKAPEGFKLLTEAAFTGTLPTDTLSVELTVVNARTFTMPETGAISGAVLRVLGLAAAISCLCMLSVLSRKRHW